MTKIKKEKPDQKDEGSERELNFNIIFNDGYLYDQKRNE